jgi:hypothetical protein
MLADYVLSRPTQHPQSWDLTKCQYHHLVWRRSKRDGNDIRREKFGVVFEAIRQLLEEEEK